jgi:hypothetical protein
VYRSAQNFRSRFFNGASSGAAGCLASEAKPGPHEIAVEKSNSSEFAIPKIHCVSSNTGQEIQTLWGQTMPQLADTTVHDHMLMNLDIAHRAILVSQAALEVSFDLPKKETPSRKPFPPKQSSLPRKLIRRKTWYPLRLGSRIASQSSLHECAVKSLVSIQQQEPIVLEPKRIERTCRFFGEPPW